MAARGSATLFVPGRPKRKSSFRGFRIRSTNPDGLTLTIFTFKGEDLTDEQQQFLEENREQNPADDRETIQGGRCQRRVFRECF